MAAKLLLTLPAPILSLGVVPLLVKALILRPTGTIVTGRHLGFWPTVRGALAIRLVNSGLRRALRSAT